MDPGSAPLSRLVRDDGKERRFYSTTRTAPFAALVAIAA